MKKEIISEFKKYDWIVDYSITKVSDTFYKIQFPNCFIGLYIDNMYKSIECYIKYKGNEYDLESALRFNNKKIGNLYHNQSEIELSEYLKQYTEIINSELLNFILDDFSWCNRVNHSLGF